MRRSVIVREIARDYAYVVGRRWRSLRRGMTPDAPRSSTLRPVVLIPGVFESWHYLEALGEHLSARGHPVHQPAELGLTRRPIPQTADDLHRYLEQHALSDVVIVGHSKGGLIAKQMLLRDADSRIARVVAINAPFAGSPWARYAISSWREFSPQRPVMRALVAATDVNERIVSIYSRVDQYVPGSSRLEGAINIELPLAGHFWVLAHPRVLTEVTQWAGAPTPRAHDSVNTRPTAD